MGQSIQSLNSEDGFGGVQSFRNHSEKLAQLLVKGDVNILPYKNVSNPWFIQLPESEQNRVLTQIKTHISILQEVLQQGYSLRDSKRLMWQGLKQSRLTFRSDLFDYFQDDDVIEVYDKDNIQIFCNLNFYDFCSYTLEDVYCRPWVELFVREEPENVSKLIPILEGFYSGELNKTVSMDFLGEHLVKETDSAFHHELNIRIKYLSPIYDEDSKQPAGFIAIERAKLISSDEHKGANKSAPIEAEL